MSTEPKKESAAGVVDPVKTRAHGEPIKTVETPEAPGAVALPKVDPANAVQDPSKILQRADPPPPEIELEPATYWQIKSLRQDVVIAGERMVAAESSFNIARAAQGKFEKEVAENLKMKVSLGAYHLEDEGTRAILNLRQMPAGVGGPPPRG